MTNKPHRPRPFPESDCPFERPAVGTCEHKGCLTGSIDHLKVHPDLNKRICESCWAEVEAGLANSNASE